MVTRLCLPMSSARLDSNPTTMHGKPKFGVARVCVQIDASLP